MQWIYGAMLLLSLLLLPLYLLVRKKQNEPWLLLMLICVATVNLGYTLVAFSTTVDFALLANKITYLGQVVLPFCMFMLISKLCGYTYKRWVLIALAAVAALLFALICTAGYLDWYYTSASIEKVAGATVLHKEYGALHPLNLVYVILYFAAMLAVLGLSLKERKDSSQKHACGMLVIVLGNIVMWCIGKVIPWGFELLSVSYLMSAGGFLVEWLMLQDYVHKRDIPKYTPAERETLAVRITEMNARARLARALAFVKEDKPLSIREREILEMIIAGKKRRETAEALHLSENTVKTYTRSLYGKLGVTCREELYELVIKENEATP